jgi:hypothetical protein
MREPFAIEILLCLINWLVAWFRMQEFTAAPDPFGRCASMLSLRPFALVQSLARSIR